MWVHGINVDHWPTIIAIIRCLDFVYIYIYIHGEKLELWIFLLELLRGVNQLNYKTIGKDFITSKVKMLSRERERERERFSYKVTLIYVTPSLDR